MRVNARVPQEYNRINLEPISGALGAIVHGVDMRELDDEMITELHQAWMDHKVLFFRNQELTSAQHVEYGKAFGELEIHPFTSNLEEQPEIIVLESTPENFVAAESWHSDVTFRECPPKGSVLVGRVLPPYGGDTAWADMQLAYERLPDGLKEQIEGLYAIHSYEKVFGANRTGHRHAVDEVVEKAKEQYPPQRHPIVRTHPETGIKSLFINRNFVTGIDGMTQDESRWLRHRLYEQVNRLEITCRFRWQPGSVAQWDNRCTQHYAIPDYGGFHRRMERVTMIGDRPR
ncbi:MAG: TauD/TfdA dioxygenase family protein [Ilumatobacteraceae bacterium]